MQYWLMKSEPDVCSIDQQKKVGAKGAPWDGVRNYQAANNLKKMQIGDLCFFYHSNIGKEIVGIVKVIKESFPDKTDKKNKFVVIIAGYADDLEKSFFAHNKGLRRRFPFKFTIEKYNHDQLADIFIKKINDIKFAGNLSNEKNDPSTPMGIIWI